MECSLSLKKLTKNLQINIKDKISKNIQIMKITERWREIMAGCNLKNYRNDTFGLRYLTETNYGYKCAIKIPDGFTFEDLENKKRIIEDNFPCLLQMKKNPISNYIDAKIITKKFSPKIDYEPPQTKPWECFVGMGVDLQPIIVDMCEFSHIMDTGATGTGKSRLIDVILTTLIHNHDVKEVNFYMIQVEKNDLFMYEDCKQVKFITDNIYKANAKFKQLAKIVRERNKLFLPYKKKGMFSNIKGYNEFFPEKKLPIIYVVIDEFTGLMPQSYDSENIKGVKQESIGYLSQLIRLGRSCGIFLITGLQRATHENYPAFMKSQINVNISFRQNNPRSSEVATGDNTLALRLPKREGVCITDDIQYFKTPFITDNIILEFTKANHVLKRSSNVVGKMTCKTVTEAEKNAFLRELKERKRGTINNKTWSINKKAAPINLSLHNVEDENVKKQIIKHNESKIKGFVEYKPIDETKVKVIDQTVISNKTSKPLKK